MSLPFDISKFIWYVLRVQPNKEIDIAFGLVDAGYNAYCPYIVRVHRNRHTNKKEYTAIARFIGYLIVGFKETFLPSKRIFEPNLKVQAVLGIRGDPSPLPVSVVESLFITPEKEIEAPFLKNDRVVINKGAFAGKQCVVEEILPDRAIVGLLNEYSGDGAYKTLSGGYGLTSRVEVPLNLLSLTHRHDPVAVA